MTNHPAQHVLNPCPTCGRRFDFEWTGCMTFVLEFLKVYSQGNCPECGTRVVVDFDEQKRIELDVLRQAETREAKLAVLIVDLPLSVLCRNRLHKAGLRSLSDLVSLSLAEVRQILDGTNRLEELNQMLDTHGLELRP